MTLDFAQNGRGRIRCKLKTAIGIESIDSLEQTQIANLNQIVEGLTAILEFICKEADEIHMGHDKLLASIRVTIFLKTAKELTGALLIPCDLARRGLFGH